jgi:quinohemoprotein ethanol dehydrogenase
VRAKNVGIVTQIAFWCLASTTTWANGAADVDDHRLVDADRDRENWITHGRTYSEERYSPLAYIHDGNVNQLELLWSFPTGLTRGHEATPIVVEGVLYFTGPWSVVFAVDARTGKQLWRYDPQVPKETGKKGCCDVVNRGVAVYRGHVYSAAFDGRLIALDARSGERVWEVLTVDASKPYTITGAPRIVKGKVVIGNGGGEFGVRGYVSAYDARDGSLAWRTYTVPGNPADGFETPALEKAAGTWTGEWWKFGGGGTVWDSMAYDPDLDLLYVGTGNGSPWARRVRSPQGGDNLYLSSILALRPDTGEMVWHFQTTPADTWDFTATQHMILANLEVDGRARKVLMQAPKNGYFYVIDRETGAFISANNYVTVTWSTGLDPVSGRPTEAANADFGDGLAFVRPTPFGGHNWHPMSFSPKTGLVYIPTHDIQGVYRDKKDFEFRPGEWNTGTDKNAFSLLAPEFAEGNLIAWDPVAQKEAWRHPYARPWNGGTLVTAGNLVFQGTADARFVAYAADNGRQLWEELTGAGVIAAPVTYMVDGNQYVSILAGWGGAFGLIGGEVGSQLGGDPNGRLLTYALRSPPPTTDQVAAMLDEPGDVADGGRLYHEHCAVCHGINGVAGRTSIPDLRRSPLPYVSFEEVVRGGVREKLGMPSFANALDADDLGLIWKYVDSRRPEASTPGSGE